MLSFVGTGRQDEPVALKIKKGHFVTLALYSFFTMTP